MGILYPTRQHMAIYAMLFVLLVFLTPKAGYAGDVIYWQQWGSYMLEHGLGRVYDLPDNNYPPLFHYILFLFGKITGSVEKLVFYRHFIKLFILPFDFAGALLAAWYFAPGDRNQRFTASLLLLGNLAFVYNTVVWEQVDALFSCLVFGAVVLALRQRSGGSIVCYVLALNVKTQAVIFLPPLLLLWAPLWWQRPRALLAGVSSAALVQLAVLLPFILAGGFQSLSRIGHVVIHGVDFYPYASMNAHNWWDFWVANAWKTPDTLRFAGLTYKQWGLLSFCLASAAVLLPLAGAVWGKLRRGQHFDPADYAPLLLTLGLLPIVFTYFNTQMHERYWHPALLFLAGYAFLTRRYFLYGLFSLAYLLNLESQMHYLGLKKYGVAVFGASVGAPLFTIVLVVGVVQLYRLVARTPGWGWAISGSASGVPVSAS